MPPCALVRFLKRVFCCGKKSKEPGFEHFAPGWGHATYSNDSRNPGGFQPPASPCGPPPLLDYDQPPQSMRSPHSVQIPFGTPVLVPTPVRRHSRLSLALPPPSDDFLARIPSDRQNWEAPQGVYACTPKKWRNSVPDPPIVPAWPHTMSDFRPAIVVPTPVYQLPILPTPNPLDRVLESLAQIQPDRYHWKTETGELTLTPNEIGKATLPLPPVGLPPSISHSHTGFVLNPWLAPTQHPQITWDVTRPPSWAHHAQDDPVFQLALHDSATDPPTAHLGITLAVETTDAEFSWLWGPIEARGTMPIRVGDVLYAVWNYLRVPMTGAEVGRVRAAGGRGYKVLCGAFERRVAAQPGGEARRQEYAGGLRRVDWLGSQTRFWGMWVGADGKVWVGLVG